MISVDRRVVCVAFTRLTNAFSRKVDNLDAAPYPRTPARAAGITDHVWKIEEIVALLDASPVLA